MAPARSIPRLDRSLLEWLLFAPVAGIVAVPAIVVPAIIWARIAFHNLHPNADPGSYLTISRAISDPAIGEPFAFWVTIAAVLLWISVHAILWMFIAQHPGRPAISTARDRASRLLWAAMWVTMTATCIGMVMLSHFRLGDGPAGHRLHMIGSYVFFAGQAVTILFAAVYNGLIARAPSLLGTAVFTHRARARSGVAVFLAAVLYGLLFRVKSMDFGDATAWVITAYVELETILIIVFLAYLAAFLVDVARFVATPASGARAAAAVGDETASEEGVPDPVG
ncbi:MAG: Frag1/DRAM/Sfk1 family protein [Siculibacillus sp.]|nr:Frag1/DRAM/Sfk1 family protein [Siculibacillus sp.]